MLQNIGLICSHCDGKMVKILDGDLYECEECRKVVSAVEEGDVC